MNNKGLLVVFSGPSGVGKGTVLKEYLAGHSGVKVSVSATTRAPRPGEVDGVHYHFVTEQEFLAIRDRDGMLEWACYNGNYYGTPREMVERERAAGYDVVLEIEVQGAKKVKLQCPDALMIFVLPPTVEELKSRLIGRNTEDPETIRRRLNAAREELAQAHCYEYAVVNDDIQTAARKLGAILEAAKCGAAYMKDWIDEVQKKW